MLGKNASQSQEKSSVGKIADCTPDPAMHSFGLTLAYVGNECLFAVI